MISESQIVQLKNGTPVFKEALAISSTVAYGKDVFYPGDMIRLLPTADVDVKLCTEYLYGSELGRSRNENAERIWVDNAEGEELGNETNITEGMADTSNITLDLTRGNLNYSHVLEFNTDDIDDAPRFQLLSPGRNPAPLQLPGGVITVSINHIESAALSVVQFQLREERRPNVVGGTAQAYYYGTASGTFGAAEVWNDITGSATEAWFHATITVADYGLYAGDGNAYYTLALRPKENWVGSTCHISHLGVHETVVNGAANRLAQDVEYFFMAKERCRIGADMTQGTGTLYISKMEA